MYFPETGKHNSPGDRLLYLPFAQRLTSSVVIRHSEIRDLFPPLESLSQIIKNKPKSLRTKVLIFILLIASTVFDTFNHVI